MRTQEIDYEADGTRRVGYLAVPDGTGKRPGVLVCHEGPGIDDHAKGRARRLAGELGYVAFALDYIGNAAHSFTNPNAGDMRTPGIEYHEPTDRRSWQAMLDLFAETFG